MVQKEECDICNEFINKTKHKKVICPFVDTCGKNCCRLCFNRFLLENSHTPICIWCNKNLSMEFIYDNTTRKFYDEYMDYRLNITMDIKKSQLPALQGHAENIIRIGLLRKELDTYHRIIKFSEIRSSCVSAIYAFSKCYKAIGITSRNHFTGIPLLTISNWESYLRIDDKCSLCNSMHSIATMKTCSGCNIVKCSKCLQMCLLVNNTKCLICGTEEFPDNIDDILMGYPKIYYTKFFKKEKDRRQQNKLEFKQAREDIIDAVKRKLEINNNLVSFCLELYNIKYGTEYGVSNTIQKEAEKEAIKFIIEVEMWYLY